MNEQQVREIVRRAFKARFGDIDIVSIDIEPGFDFYDEPKLEVRIVYDAEVERVIGPDAGLNILKVRSEIVEKVWEEPENSPGWPYLHFIAKSDIDRRNSAAA